MDYGGSECSIGGRGSDDLETCEVVERGGPRLGDWHATPNVDGDSAGSNDE